MLSERKRGRNMATKFEFFLSDEDTERLFAVKEDHGLDELTGNEYAKRLLEDKLRQLHPNRVKYDLHTGERVKCHERK